MRENIVLLTATITPRANQQNLKLADPIDRLNDYKLALGHYNKLLENGVIDRLVFVENSGYDLVELSNIYPNPRIEWLSAYDMNYPITFHRGYGEFRLIDHAMKNSLSIVSSHPAAIVWKVTGRYIIENLPRVIRFAPKRFDLYCDSSDRWTEMSLMAWTKFGHERLLQNVWELFSSGMAPELILAPLLLNVTGTECVVVREFCWPPLVIGRRGTDGGQFAGSLTRWKFRAALLPKLIRVFRSGGI